MSSEGRSTLPTGSANSRSLPPHMATETKLSSFTDSIGSNDSFESQAPLPFHMREDNKYPPRPRYTVEDIRSGYEISDQSTDSDDRKTSSSSSRSLNPKSREYIPTGNTPVMGHDFDQHLPMGGMRGSYGHNHQFTEPPTYIQPYGYGYNQQVVYQNNGLSQPYKTRNRYHADPYAHYGVPNGQGQYNNGVNDPQDRLYHDNNNPRFAHVTAGGSYAPPAGSGESHHYGRAPLSSSSYNSHGYKSDGYSRERFSSNCGVPQAPGYCNGNQNNYQQLPYRDENRFRSQPPSSSNSGTSGLNLRNDSFENVEHNHGFGAHQIENGPYYNNNSGTHHNAHFIHHNDRQRNNDFRRNSSLAVDDRHNGYRDDDQNNDFAPTTPVRQPLNEASVPVREKTSTWLEKISTTHEKSMQEIVDRLRSPVQHQSTALTRVNGNDPFTTPVHRPHHSMSNPLTPASTIRSGALSLYTNDGFSPQYKLLTKNGTCRPNVDEALLPVNIPFIEYCRTAIWDELGVIKIRNIPYGVSRQEIMAFLGRNARLVSEGSHEPVHIVMERVTSKTLDCYVEFISFHEAVSAVHRFEGNRTGGKGGRLGDRHVDVELSSQDQLMKDLFPKAKNVKWLNGRPEIIPRDPDDRYNSGFAGFLSKEEMVMLVKHVEAPQRSPFSKDCPQRPFECLISTLLKYPWYAVEHITIQDRNLLHETTKQLVRMLHQRVNNQDPDRKESIHVNNMLLKRVWRAVLACPGFTPTMKDDIVVICELDENYCYEYGLPRNADAWRYLWTLGPKANVPQDVLDLYIGLIRDYTLQDRRQMSLAEQAALGGGAPSHEFKLFGDLEKFIKYPEELANRTLAQVAHVEWTAIEDILRRALTPALR